MQQIVDTQFEGKISVAAKAEPKISHSMLSEFLSGSRGAGIKLLTWISARMGNRSIDELLGRTSRPSPPTSGESSDPFPERHAALAPFVDSPDPAHRHAIKQLVEPGHKGTQAWTRERWTKAFLQLTEEFRADEADPSRREAAAARSDATLREHLNAPTVADAVARERKNRR